MCEAAPALPCLRCVYKDYTAAKQSYETAATVHRHEAEEHGSNHPRATKAAEVVEKKEPILAKHERDLKLRAVHSDAYHRELLAAQFASYSQVDDEGQPKLDANGKKVPVKSRADLHPVHQADLVFEVDRLATAIGFADELMKPENAAEYEALREEAEVAAAVERLFRRMKERASSGDPAAWPDTNAAVLAVDAYIESGQRPAPKVPLNPNHKDYAKQVEKLHVWEKRQALLSSLREEAVAEAKARLAAGEEFTRLAVEKQERDALLKETLEANRVASEARNARRAEEAARTGRKTKAVEPTSLADHQRMGEKAKAEKRRAVEAEEKKNLLAVTPVIPSALMAQPQAPTPVVESVVPAVVAQKPPVSVPAVVKTVEVSVAVPSAVTAPVAAPVIPVVAPAAAVIPALPPLPGTKVPQEVPQETVATQKPLPVLPSLPEVPARPTRGEPPVLSTPQVQQAPPAAPVEHDSPLTKLLRRLGIK